MRGARSTRILAILVAALFFAGEAGMSGLDAVLFHRAGVPDSAAVRHVERGRGTSHHADQCLLAFRLANGRLSPSLGLAIRFEGIPSHETTARPPAEPHRSYTGLHQQSRAPPAPLAGVAACPTAVRPRCATSRAGHEAGTAIGGPR
jgi:hypothetical protein